MSKILLYGVSAAGKTTLSKLLREKTKLPLVHGDNIREEGYPGTKTAWRKYGPLSKENAVKGLHYVREYMQNDVRDELAKYDQVIFEAVFIDPAQYQNKANTFLIATSDETEHRKHFFERWPETDERIESFRAVRIIQEYLIEEAKDLGIKIIYNTGTPGEVLKKIILE